MNILNQADREAFFQGVLRWEETANGLRPWRFTAGQARHYAQAEAWDVRSRCGAGQLLALETDSPTVALEFTVQPGARNHLHLDAEVDNVMRRLIDFDDVAEESLRLVIPLPDHPEGKGHTLRFLHHHCRPLLWHAIEVDAGATVAPLPRPPRRLLCLGDSITQGMTALYPFSTYTTELARLLDAELLNQGVGGDVFDPAALDEGIDFTADFITIAYGTNDWNGKRPLETVQATLAAYLEKLKTIWPQARVALLTPLWRTCGGELREGRTLCQFGAGLAAVAQDAGVPVIDGLTLVPNGPLYFADGTHPTDLGFMHYATNLYRALRQAWHL